MSRPGLRSLLVVISVLLCAGVVACGGSEKKGPDARKVLDQTFGKKAPAPARGRVVGTFAVDASGLPALGKRTAIRLGGPYAARSGAKLPRFDFTFALASGGDRLKGQAISSGDRGFLKLGGRTYVVEGQIFSVLADEYARAQGERPQGRRGGPTVTSFGVDPRDWMTHPVVRGTQRVGGVPATHVVAGIDVGGLIVDVNQLLGQADVLSAVLPGLTPQPITARTRKQVLDAVRSAKAEVWTGVKDHVMRRLRVAVRFKPGGSSRRPGRLNFDLRVSQVGAPQHIPTPSGGLPLSRLLESPPDLPGGG
ncbi:MAG: hypothetical protein M3296_06060 [Actinomycetota bacterium]|nr:hypothetical protein [Actinomycetota bacterium]